MRTATTHGLWGMGQMMFTKYLIVVDDECLRTATRRTQHQRSPLPPLRQHRSTFASLRRDKPATRLSAEAFAKEEQHLHQRPVRRARPRPSEIASGSKLGIDATKNISGEGFKRPWPPVIKMDAEVKAKVEKLFNP